MKKGELIESYMDTLDSQMGDYLQKIRKDLRYLVINLILDNDNTPVIVSYKPLMRSE